MKRIAIVFVILIFVFFAYLGFQAASNLKLNSSGGNLPANAATALAKPQQNYILIHVDDLSRDKPNLISVWGVFVYYAGANQVMFIPMLPTYDAAVQSSLAAAFTLDKTGAVNSKFISELSKQFDVEITGIIATDNVGLTFFNALFTGQNTQILAVPPQTDDEKHLVLANGQLFFQSVCGAVTNKNISLFNAIDWSQLVPGHFVTTLPFETIMADLQKLVQSTAANQCSVLSNE